MSGNQAHLASASLYVGDLNPDVTEATLYEVFNTVGPVASLRVCRESNNRKSLGYAYVNYHSIADAERALDTLNYQAIKGQPCRIMWCHRDPSLRRSGVGNVFVKNLDKTIDNKSLYDTFSLFGNIMSCKVALDEFGKSRGFGFVHYEDEHNAAQAIERVNGMQIGSKTVYVGPFQKRTERPNNPDIFTNLYVKNIPEIWNEDKLRDLFGPYGVITSIALKSDPKTRKFAFINFEQPEEAKAAIDALDGKLVNEGEDVEPYDGDEAENPNKLLVTRFQSKMERITYLRNKFGGADGKNKEGTVNLYVKNLEETIDDEELKKLFTPIGEVMSAKVMIGEGGASRGFGFVTFAKQADAAKAVTEMHLRLIKNKPLYVALAEKKEDRVRRIQQRMRMPNMRMPRNQFHPPVYMSGPNYPLQQQQGSWPRGQPMIHPMMGMSEPRRGPPRARYPPPMMSPGGMPNPMGIMHHPRSNAPPPPSQQQQQQQMGPSMDQPQIGSAGIPLKMQKRLIGEKLYPKVSKYQADYAGKITGMMLDMDTTELMHLLESETLLKAKVDEAMNVLQQAGRVRPQPASSYNE